MVNHIPSNSFQTGKKWQQWGVIVAVAAMISACGPQVPPPQVPDPGEQANRNVHEFNKGFDTYLFRPASQVYGTVLPGPVRQGVANVSEAFEAPVDVVNSILQGKPDEAAQNTLRFAVNMTMGIAGLFDAATALGMPKPETDFGETLHVWGAPEGNYVELPVFGPSTERDTVGRVVDAALNPLQWLGPIDLGSRLGDRYRFANTFDSVLYDSEDSYSQTKLAYIQNRRFELGQDAPDADAIDPYEDPYAE
jgi:phospholipid-binding lipoprotein MlaA